MGLSLTVPYRRTKHLLLLWALVFVIPLSITAVPVCEPLTWDAIAEFGSYLGILVAMSYITGAWVREDIRRTVAGVLTENNPAKQNIAGPRIAPVEKKVSWCVFMVMVVVIPGIAISMAVCLRDNGWLAVVGVGLGLAMITLMYIAVTAYLEHVWRELDEALEALRGQSAIVGAGPEASAV